MKAIDPNAAPRRGRSAAAAQEGGRRDGPFRVAPSLAASAYAAACDVASPPFRAVLFSSLALTVAGLALLGIGLGKLVAATLLLPHAAWLATVLHFAAFIVIFAVLVLLATPVAFVAASFFFDRLAACVEAAVDAGCVGRPLPFAQASWIGLRFAALSLVVNALALALSLLPGVNALVFFGANAYLLGRGFFEMAALRHCSLADVRWLRRRFAGRIFAAGCLCAGLASVPVINLLTPLFATALLVRVALPLVARQPLSAV